MSRTPGYVSVGLSEVMNIIGVNTTHVRRRQKACILRQNIETLSFCDNKCIVYYFGSQCEGSTTLGLKSDHDTLYTGSNSNIIQNWSEWKPGVGSMMIQNENISPGYCHLLLIREDIPLASTANDIRNEIMEYCFPDSDGNFLLKNTVTENHLRKFSSSSPIYQMNGPAITRPAGSGWVASDIVFSFWCESSPHQVTSWLQERRQCTWPTDDVLKDCRNVGCFLVPVGSKVSYTPQLEWRISTSLQERFLMFSLNITQLRCYVLMKMILKTYLNPHAKDVLSSFMCKNVLWYCVANSSHEWHAGNLLSYLHLCLFMLKECVEQRNCPHCMIPENNLLAGRMTDTQRGILLDIINNLMKNDEQLLCEIQMDDLGLQLKKILYTKSYRPDFLPDAQKIIEASLVFEIVKSLSRTFNENLAEIKLGSLEMAWGYLLLTSLRLERKKINGHEIRHTARKLLIPFVRSALGSVIASANIDTHAAISDQAFTYLEAGKESDALSGRLKFVSVLYCTGDMERTESELRIIGTQYSISDLHSVCDCIKIPYTLTDFKSGFMNACQLNIEPAIKSHLALCTRFLQCEINCVPHELRYEILRSYIKEDRQMRDCFDAGWMDYINVDSIPYLYFLQYKTYGHLQNRKYQEKALYNLALSINFEHGLGHKETALNLLGQCMEQENKRTEAFQCYIRSLKYRERNTAARFLLCIQLFKLCKQDKTL